MTVPKILKSRVQGYGMWIELAFLLNGREKKKTPLWIKICWKDSKGGGRFKMKVQKRIKKGR